MWQSSQYPPLLGKNGILHWANCERVMQREKEQDMPSLETSEFLSATRSSVIASKIAPDNTLDPNQKSLLFHYLDHLSDCSDRYKSCGSVSFMLGSIFLLTVIVIALLFSSRDVTRIPIVRFFLFE
jgi:hypothetical protein